jgi:hypothetical protein
MPTKLNIPASAKPLVPLKKTENCSLKRHFKGCARQVVGYLDLLAGKDPDRFVWMSVNNIVEHCKNYSKKDKAGAPTKYTKSAVEKALKDLRDAGVLSYPVKVPVQERRGFIVDECFVLAAHDALTVREECACRFVGPGRVPGTTWAAASSKDAERSGGNMWYVKKGREKGMKNTVIVTVGITDGITVHFTDSITDRITDASTVKDDGKTPEHYGVEYGREPGDAPEIIKDSVEPQKVSQEFSEGERAPNPCIQLVSQDEEARVAPLTRPDRQTGNALAPLLSPDSLTKTGDNGSLQDVTTPNAERLTPQETVAQAETAQETQETNHPIAERPHRPAIARAPEPACTIAEHFESAEIPDNRKLSYLQVATDGLLTFDPQNKNVWGQSLDKELTAAYEEADAAIRRAVERMGHAMMIGRKSLVEVLNMAINEMPTKKLPKPVFKVMKELKESGGAAVLTAAKRSVPARSEQKPEELDPVTKARLVAWTAFNDSSEGRKYRDVSERAAAFENIWRK